MIHLSDAIKSVLPWESKFFGYRENARLHFLDEGPRDAPALVMVHGNPTWSFYYRSLIKHFSRNYRVIALDFLGMGLSSKEDGPAFRAIDRAAELEALLSHLGIGKFWMIMHDWGGPIGTRIALDRLSQVQGLVYLNTTLTETESLPPFIKLAASGPFSKLITATTTQFIHFTTRFGAAKALPKFIREAYFLPFPNARSRRAVYDFVRDIPFSADHPTHDNLSELAAELPKFAHTPVLILWGLRDPVFHRGMLKRVAQHFPHAKVIEYPDASHLLLEDKPDEVTAEIEHFIGSVDHKTKSNGVLPTSGLQNLGAGFEIGPTPVQSFIKFSSEQADKSGSIEVCISSAQKYLPTFLSSGKGVSLSYDMMSFRDLQARMWQYQRGLSALGVTPGKRILMLVTPGHDFLAFAFAVMACGAVPVFIDPGIGIDKMCSCIEQAQAEGCIVSAKAQLLILLKRKLFRDMKVVVNAGRLPFGFGTNLEFFSRFSAAPSDVPKPDPTATGLVAFTSGATGTPKGVEFSNANLARQTQIFADSFKVSSGSRDFPLLPIFSIYGAACGAGSIFYPTDPGKPLNLDPDLVCKVIRDLAPDTSFGSPTLWGKISSFALAHAINFPSLQRVFMAGTSVPLMVLKQVGSVCPKAQLFTPYGATEALPITLSPASELPTNPEIASNGMTGIPVGKPVAGVEVKVIEISESPIASFQDAKEVSELTIGELLVAGPNISLSYLNREDSNLKGKIRDGNRTWHRIGDAGYVGSKGDLYYCGRVVHRVDSKDKEGKSLTLFSEPVELIFLKHAKVKRAALIKFESDVGAAIAIEPHPQYFPRSQAEKSQFEAELRILARQTSFTAALDRFFFFHSFPVDARHNAKVFRDELGRRVSQQQAEKS